MREVVRKKGFILLLSLLTLSLICIPAMATWLEDEDEDWGLYSYSWAKVAGATTDYPIKGINVYESRHDHWVSPYYQGPPPEIDEEDVPGEGEFGRYCYALTQVTLYDQWNNPYLDSIAFAEIWYY